MPINSSIDIKLTGPWEATAVALLNAPEKIQDAWLTSASLHLGSLRDAIRKKYKSAKPALAASTLLVRKRAGRGGSKPLIVGGDLRNSVSLTENPGGIFVGVLRGAKGDGGKSMYNIAEIHEQGRTFAVPATARSKRFLASMFGNPAIINSPAKFFIVRIPARPVFAPAFKAWDKSAFENSVASDVQKELFGNLVG